ncbi:MAG: CusA/CzcA family heavy metal efflux RND transporter [Puniceicoccales bacterium]|jgi:cobalt-zinc-cadmium resistance protein CzcA|nr:CusA/CzcA family heavy metal efflux RND transporter [Puniceicoccales bacterium]
MIPRILQFSLGQRAFIVFAALILIALGIHSATRLPMDAVPDITNTQVQINTAVPALAPEEIEKLVTTPIETEMGGMEKLEEIRSLTKAGLSQVTLIFKDGTDIYRARQLAGERLQAVAEALPSGAVPKLAPITTGLGEIYHYTVRYTPGYEPATTDEAALRHLRAIQDYTLKPALRTVPGVAEVNTSGGSQPLLIVSPDPAKLTVRGLTIDDISRAISANTRNAGGAILEKGGEGITVRIAGRVANAKEIATLPLKFSADTSALRVGDVASVTMGSAVRNGAATHNGREAVIGSVLMLTGENSRVVAKRVREKLDTLANTLPQGIEIETLYDRTSLVERTIATVGTNLLEGALLVMSVLLALLGNWRAALIVASAIPLSMLFAITGMVQLGVPGNLMSLGAVDFGLIVDGAVVMTENIVRVLDERRRGLARELLPEERRQAVFDACRQVGVPTVLGVAIISIVYLPLFALTGVEGKTFAPMALTVLLALAGALLLTLTLVPVLAASFLHGRANTRSGESLAFSLARRAYQPVLRLALRARWLPIALAVGACAGAAVIFPSLGSEFIPRLDEGDMAAQIIRTGSISLGASMEMQKATEKRLMEKFPELRSVFSRVGTSEVATDPMGVNVGDTYILLHPREKWRTTSSPHGDKRPITKDELATLMSREMAMCFPAQTALFSQPIELRFNELLSGSRADIVVKIFGENHDVLGRLAAEAREILEHIPGAGEVEMDATGRTPTLQITMDREAMARLNVHADAVNAVVEGAHATTICGLLIEGSKRIPIATQLPGEMRNDIAIVEQIGVRTQDGGLVPLGRIARVEMVEAASTIQHEAFQRRTGVQVNLRGRDIASFVAEARVRLAKELQLPEGYRVEFGGAFKNLEVARARLILIVPAALLLIFALIQAAFGSVRQTLVVYTGVPLALTGGIIALWLRGMPFSISASVGFIALSGVAVLNGLVLVSFINQLRAAGRPLAEATEEGALARLRPVLMTALVASLGFAPMAISTSTGAEVQRPLATVVIGGILSATFLTLLLLPTLYAWVEHHRGEKIG